MVSKLELQNQLVQVLELLGVVLAALLVAEVFQPGLVLDFARVFACSQ